MCVCVCVSVCVCVCVRAGGGGGSGSSILLRLHFWSGSRIFEKVSGKLRRVQHHGPLGFSLRRFSGAGRFRVFPENPIPLN